MTAHERVRRARRWLLAVAVLRTLAVGLGLGLFTILAALAADRLLDLPRALRSVFVPLAVVVGVGVGLGAAWRLRAVRSVERVALWLEERFPTHFALVTALDQRFAGEPRLERAAAGGTRDGELLRDTAARALLAPIGLIVVTSAALSAVPGPVRERILKPHPGDILAAGAGAPLAAWIAEVVPPAYTGRAADTLESPLTIRAIEGSAITLTGRGEGILCGFSRGRCRAESRDDRWQVRFAMPDSATTLMLGADTAQRLLALIPQRDSLPTVLLRQPERDTVLRAAEGVIALAADVRDDFGVTAARFEYVISSGFGESYTFREGRMEGRPEGQTIHGRLDIGALGLAGGDVVHVRAVAEDAGPPRRGPGVSSTRAIRIARDGEYDSVSVVALPPLPLDTSALSQRLLIQLTEALIARIPRLARATVIEESRTIGRDQARLRRVVSDVLFMRLGGDPEGEHSHDDDDEAEDLSPEALLAAASAATGAGAGEALDFHGDETPVVAINRPLLEAYNAMWDAGRELNVGEPRRALPYMYAALEAIQRARAAERIYLRGRPRVSVLDLDAVRLVGDRTRTAATQRDPRPGDADRPATRLARATGRTDSLLVLRVELLDTHPDAAAAIGEAIDAMRAGRPVGDALTRARALLAGAPVPAATRWGAW